MEAPGIFLITGPVQGGKTTFLAELCRVLEKRGLKTGGFLCPGSFDSGQRSGFSLLNTGTGEEVTMASVLKTKNWMKYRRFWFNPDAFNQGREWVRECLMQETQIIVIDEVGPMELEGSGWSDLLEALEKAPVPLQLWTVRENLLPEVMERWGIPGDRVINIDKQSVDETADMIGKILDKKEN